MFAKRMRICVILLLSCLVLGQVACANQEASKENEMGLFTKAPQAGDAGIPEGNHIRITTQKGDMVLELYADTAPNTVANFKALAGKGFYDGLKFHRVIAGFMAQAGDPEGTGMGGPGYKVKAEFNALHHERGTLAMARSQDPDSAGSQFYICFAPAPHLDGQYTIFGKLTEGFDILDGIKQGDVMEKVSVEP